ncbi:hypothetical protein M501DRAFT_1015786 [Patellaria atrata CBS 101060]|uniref:Tetraspanin Tsp3 n=1 Tax=Patellaria atrata CBS 101060 TaxID=1346257 RepID=A0A9P4SD94_9PEZI|nr:hypothetical protein M501DRAFT_1015786 [Patellaria atrata CBS 101060]
MALTKAHLTSIFSTIYLLILTAISAYATYIAHALSLPLPTAIPSLATLTPSMAGLSALYLLPRVPTSMLRQLTLNKKSQKATLTRILFFLLLTVYETVLATLAGNYISSSTQDCGLQERWKSLYRAKDITGIKRIQDSGECCGFRSVFDMAYPFPGKGHPKSTCSEMYGRNRSCLGSWRGEEKKVAGLVVLVIVGVFVWELIVIFLASPSDQSSWTSPLRPFSRLFYLPSDQDVVNGRNRQRFLEDGPNRNRYSDNPDAEGDGGHAIEDAGRVSEDLLEGDREDEDEIGRNNWVGVEGRVQPSRLRG